MLPVLARAFLRVLPDVIGMTMVLLVQGIGLAMLLQRPSVQASPRTRHALWIGAACSCALLMFAVLIRFGRIASRVPEWWSGWGRGLIIGWGMLSIAWVMGMILASWLPRPQPRHSASRRLLLQSVRAALFGVPVATLGYGTFVQRSRIRLREERIEIPDLPSGLDGLRLVQLTDLHVSPFLSVRDLGRAVDMANETRAHIAFVTGDLITSGNDPLDDCLRTLAGVRADAGVYGCMGNHEIYAGSEAYTAARGARLGMQFLRRESARLRFGESTLNLAGVDYQRFGRRYLVGAEKLVDPGAFNLLLSHNPDVFPVAARQGYQLILAGHTHGGQVRMEILGQDLNIARFFTPYVDGLYRQGAATVFVSRGIGTIGLPTRLGAPPEVALLRLCRT